MISNAEDVPVMFKPFSLKMEEQTMPPIVINVFKCYFAKLLYGDQGKLTEREIDPVQPEDISHYDDLEKYAEPGLKALHKVAVIKLNGGLGTSMGLEKAKSLITVKDSMTFLDITLRQINHLRDEHKVTVPLVFMNSFKTHLDTMMRIEGFDNGDTGIPLAFLQHRYPKVLYKDYKPADWPDNPELEWNPPGHGDIYTALVTSGLLRKLRERGFTYVFISNSDNLGATLDPRILGFMSQEKLPFVMEVAERTLHDRKGGHLAKLSKNERFVLRETAQCPDGDMGDFQDIDKHRYFNTNSLWLDLRAFEKVFVANGMMPLDLIINPKRVDPRNPDSPKCIQLETAMGSAISAFADASAVEVPRKRFAPVKTTNDLLVVMSDCYVRTKEEAVHITPERKLPLPDVRLDETFYKKIDDFESRFPEGAPSLLHAQSFTVDGDVLFHKNVEVHDAVRVINGLSRQVEVEAGKRLEGEITFD
ncbi:MAG: UTP--glucose-1-phosphate uridylyltransferase [Desulfovibrionaceae bacterium]